MKKTMIVSAVLLLALVGAPVAFAQTKTVTSTAQTAKSKKEIANERAQAILVPFENRIGKLESVIAKIEALYLRLETEEGKVFTKDKLVQAKAKVAAVRVDFAKLKGLVDMLWVSQTPKQSFAVIKTNNAKNLVTSTVAAHKAVVEAAKEAKNQILGNATSSILSQSNGTVSRLNSSSSKATSTQTD